MAPIADAKIFKLCLEYPPRIVEYPNRTKVFPQLGEALRRHPEAAPFCLRHTTRRAMLSAAARTSCGTCFTLPARRCSRWCMRPSRARIGWFEPTRLGLAGPSATQSSTPPLLQALQSENGLNRATVIWALGEVKGQEALPRLKSLYFDARADEERWAKANSALGPYMSARLNPTDGQPKEPLLKSRTALEAIGKIGPEFSQDFYRKLALDPDAEGAMRRRAAIGRVQS